MLKSGTPLIYDRSDSLTKAVYIGRDGGNHIIVTDFGNRVVLNESEYDALVTIPRWYTEHENILEDINLSCDYFSLKERFLRQIELLTDELELL